MIPVVEIIVGLVPIKALAWYLKSLSSNVHVSLFVKIICSVSLLFSFIGISSVIAL